jgi:hypothetical protein
MGRRGDENPIFKNPRAFALSIISTDILGIVQVINSETFE